MEDYNVDVLPLKRWAEADRPREKLLRSGRQNLTDAELLAILLGAGSPKETALGLAQRILLSAENNLQELGRRNLADLLKFKGVGQAKAVTLIAAFELGRRRELTDIRERPWVRSSRDAFRLLAALLQDKPHEEFWILLLNRANRVTGRELISRGGTAGTVVDSKIVFRKALQGQASGLILCHNHPSGNLRPSQADRDLTQKLKAAGALLDIAVLDHLIVVDSGYFSFADEGLL